jgi:tripeptide aminopeptidase
VGRNQIMNFNYDKMLDRFLKYVRIDTQSDEKSNSYPSTDKQLNLCKILVDQLKSLQLQDVKLTKHGYVFATLPSNLPKNYLKKVPTIGFIAHVDTSPDVSGSNVYPLVHNNYQGGRIKLPKDSEQILDPETDPALRDCLGHDIITSDGSTLLGADNKAGITEIMTAIDILKNTPSILHGEIKIAFTVDEEIGRGTKYFDVKKFGAKYAYTVDGETAGEIEDETFCADTVTVKISGKNVHPGYAKNKMINSIKVAAALIQNLPKDSMSPETTEKREGYIHPNNISGGVEETIIKFLIRDFTVEGLKKKEDLLKSLLDKTIKKFSGANADFQIEESYRNMRYILDKYPQVVQCAIKAVERAGIKAKKSLIRGGTDGARLSFMGLPTPNIFTGGHNFHSKKEWISVQDMQKATETIVHLSLLWVEEGDK